MVTGQFIEKIVEITWYDSWMDIEETEPSDWEDVCVVYTVGKVTRVTDKYVSLSPEWFDTRVAYRATTHIHIPSIKSVKILED